MLHVPHFAFVYFVDAFLLMGGVILASALSTVLITIPGHRGILFGKDSPAVMKNETLSVPTPDTEKQEELNA